MTHSMGAGVREARTYLARAVWLVCAVAAVALALGALLIVVDANPANPLVKFVLHVADIADLNVFSRTDGIKTFHGHNAATDDALFNWGIGAVVWLVVGRLLERLIRPGH
jgi:hypothetical protein